MTVRYASNSDIDSIRDLWNLVFLQEEAFADIYFKRLFSALHVVVAEENGMLAGMAHRLPCRLDFAEHRLCGYYIFAVAVHPQMRRRGICTSMMNFLHDSAAFGNCDFFSLIPAELGLFEFYAKMGYRPFFYTDTERVSISGVSDNSFVFREPVPEDAAALNLIYEKNMMGRCHLLRSEEYWHFLFDTENIVIAEAADKICGYAFYGNSAPLRIYELFTDGCAKEDLLSFFAVSSSAAEITFPAEKGAACPIGMVKFTGEKCLSNFAVCFPPPYMNLLFNT